MQGSATLSMAYAGALFADACLRGLNGEPDVEEFCYVESQVVPELSFFSSRVRLGPSGELLNPMTLQALSDCGVGQASPDRRCREWGIGRCMFSACIPVIFSCQRVPCRC